MHCSAAAGASGTVPTGLPAGGSVPWGTHLCHFYTSARDLEEALVPYFREGLANGDRCLWITSAPLGAAAAREALGRALPELPQYEASGQIEILDAAEWYGLAEGKDSRQVLDMWLERERAALACGFSGLRLTGNTMFVERRDWETFTRYEAEVHEAFHGRKILALCSYPLDRCTLDDVLDVVKNHELTLLRRDGAWEIIQSATELIGALQAATTQPARPHRVHFFSRDKFPAERISDFLADGLRDTGRAAAIGTAEHLAALRECLAGRGFDPSALRCLDADELVARAIAAGDGFSALHVQVEDFVREVTAGAPGAHLYGEAVDVFCRGGRFGAALELEEHWNELTSRWPLEVLCGYDLSNFRAGDGADSAHAISAHLAVCCVHDEVHVDASDVDAPLVARTLARELRRSRRFETRLVQRSAAEHDASRRLALLQRVTAALAEARTPQDVPLVLQRVLGPACDLSHVELDAAQCAEQLERPRWFRRVEDVATSGLDPVGAARALAVLPLRFGFRGHGALLLCFASEQPFGTSQRALLEDIASQVASTLERLRLHEEAEDQRASLERASRAKDEFLAMLGHELRNPLAAIRTAADLLLLTGNDARIERIHGVLDRQSTHMAKLLDGLLDVSRIVRGKITLDIHPLDLRQVLAHVLQDRATEFRAAGLELSWDPSDEPLWVDADRVRLAQVFDNLLANALKFTGPPGRVHVSAGERGDVVWVTVRDTGVGLEADLLPHVFEPFWQGAQELARTRGGLGLGLALVKGLLELQRGSVEASSDGPGSGSEFRITLPRTAASAAPALQAPGTTGSGSRVLIVEDSDDVADLLSEVLEALGHVCAVAREGESATALAARFRPQVVLCDIGLPGALSGYDVAEALRSAPWGADLNLVAMTGYGRPEDIERARRAGFDAHLTKPVTSEALRALLGAPRQGARFSAFSKDLRAAGAPLDEPAE